MRIGRWVLALALALVPSCGGEAPETAPVAREASSAFLHSARAAHRAADAAETAGKPGEAASALERLVAEAPVAASGREREALLDTLLRLAELKSAAGEHDAAAAHVAAALGLATEPGVWRGRVLEAQGVVEARRSRSLGERGEAAAAAQARDRALAAFERAVGQHDAALQAAQPALPGARVVDDGLMAFVSKARAVQHAADLLQEQGNGTEASQQLRELVDGPEPPTPAPEVGELEADALARLGEIESAAGHFDEASKAVDRGLERATDVSHYRGRLFDVRGLCEERRAAALRAAGDEPGAAAATERAIRASEQAVEIQAEVIEKALGDN